MRNPSSTRGNKSYQTHLSNEAVFDVLDEILYNRTSHLTVSFLIHSPESYDTQQTTINKQKVAEIVKVL